jgi:hypothetical protein
MLTTFSTRQTEVNEAGTPTPAAASVLPQQADGRVEAISTDQTDVNEAGTTTPAAAGVSANRREALRVDALLLRLEVLQAPGRAAVSAMLKAAEEEGCKVEIKQ